jgi:hypothetical protein
MKKGSGIILAFSAILVCTAVVHADMMPVSQQGTEHLQSPGSCEQAYLQCNNISHQSDCTCVADLDEYSFKFLHEADTDVEQTSEIQNIRSFTDGQGSFALCLYALIGLGLCRSAPWIKKLSFEFIPEWYHDGGSFQIGHSYAVTPETLYPTPAYCFVQPACMVEPLIPRHSLRTIVSLWRKSQFTPDVIASRGPPNMS